MPANDGSHKTWFSLIEPASSGQISIRHKQLVYDVATAANKMRQAMLVGGYEQSLLNGLWPSLDILPEKEKGDAGNHILPDEIVWCVS